MDFNHTIGFNDNDGDDGEFGKEIEVSIERTPANFKTNLGTRLPNAPKSLERANVRLKK